MRNLLPWSAAGLLAVFLAAAAIAADSAHLSAVALAKEDGPKHTDPGRDYYKAEGFSFVPAAGWEKQKAPPPPYFMMYSNPPAKIGNIPTLTATVNTISIENVDEIIAKVKETFQASTPQVTIVEEGKLTINGREAFFVSGTFSAQGKQYKNLQYYILNGNKKMYIFTLACLPNTMGPIRPAVEQMAKSIVVD
jgi:hypothetical protein